MILPNLGPLPTDLLPWLPVAIQVVTLLGGAAALVTWLARVRKELLNLAQPVKLTEDSVVGLKFLERLIVQTTRLAEHNIQVETHVSLLHRHEDTDAFVAPYVAAQLDLTNNGDQPVDLLACLVAGRELFSERNPGIGGQGREVEWERLQAACWNDPPDDLFQGLSTTGSVFKVRSQLVRFDPVERETLLRIDAVTSPEQLLRQRRINLLYKLFVVVVAHVAGEPLTNEQHRRWRSVQYTLHTLNSLAFRLALLGEEHATGENLGACDPLGRLTYQTAWRCFLLHHWDFEEVPGKHPTNAPHPYGELRAKGAVATINDLNAVLEGYYHQASASPQLRDDLAVICRDSLGLLVRAWRDLNETIARANAPGAGWSDLLRDDRDARARYNALAQEGYLFRDVAGRRAAPVRSALTLLTLQNGKPELVPLVVEADTQSAAELDLFVRERFAIRTKYVLATVKAPGEED